VLASWEGETMNDVYRAARVKSGFRVPLDKEFMFVDDEFIFASGSMRIGTWDGRYEK